MLNDDLTAAMERASAEPQFAPDAMLALRRADQIQRRRRRTTIGAVTLLGVIAVGAVATIWATRSDVQSVQPAGGASVLGSADGVDLTWLPPNYSMENALLPSPLPDLGPHTSYALFRDDSQQPTADDTQQGFLRHGIAITVDRGPAPNLNLNPADQTSLSARLLHASEFRPKKVAVHGHPALLWARPAGLKLYGADSLAFRLIWQESNSLTIEVDAFGGPTRAELDHVVAGLVIGPATRTDDMNTRDLAAIRTTFAQAYNAPKPAAEALAAVQDSSTVASTLARLTQALPNSVNTSRVTVGDIRFVGDDQAIVDADVVADWMNSSVDKSDPQRAVFVDGSWKISRESFCKSISAPGIFCPPLPSQPKG